MQDDLADMSGWTETTLRAAASWQAFKAGQAFIAGGAVAEAQAVPTGWAGSVRSGKRLQRVRVTVKSATDFDTRCSCVENQASGEICGHAVAVGLAVLAGGIPAAIAAPLCAPVPPVRAREILLPPNWRDSLLRGKLSATVLISRQAEVSAADHRLAEWLAKAGVAAKDPLHLHLDDGDRATAFLDAIDGHPQVWSGKDRLPIRRITGQRIRLATVSLQQNQVRLVPDENAAMWTEIGGAFWQIGEDFLSRAGEGSIPASLDGIMQPLARGGPVEIPLRLLLDHLEPWQDWLEFPANGWLACLHFVPAPASFHLTLEGSLQHLEAQLTVVYGDSTPVSPGCGRVENLPRLVDEHCEIRDVSAEARAASRLEQTGFQPSDRVSGRWSLPGESSVIHFLTHSLPRLREIWRVTEGTRLSQHSQRLTVVSPQIEILGSGEDWLAFDLKFQAEDGTFVPATEIRQWLRSGNRSAKLPGRRHWVISDDLTNLIDPLFSELDVHQKGTHFEASVRSGEVVLEIRKKLHNNLIKSDLHDYYQFLKPSTLQAHLRPYQMHGAGWLLDRVERFGGALLADDMGLGKTLQAIALIECLFAKPVFASGLVLVIATTTLLGNWRAEFARFAPGRRVRILHGAGRDAERERLDAGDVILTSYGTLARDLAWHLQRDYLAVVVDEASWMRNPDTDHARAVAKLRASHRIALTGTPVENGVRDLWSVFRFIQPGWLGGREEFRARYELPLAEGESAGAVMERLKLKTQPFLLRRTKEQVAPELPSKLFIDEYCDLSPDQQAVYRELLVEGRKRVETIADTGNSGAARMQMLTVLLRLRQTCCDLALLGNDRWNRLLVARRSAKLQRLLELLDEAVNGNHRVLIFSQFQKQLLEIEKCIFERGWGCLRLDGQTRNRQRLVEDFQDPGGPAVFLISLKAGGYGLNLTAADTVIHFDPWWNPAAEMQATDRAHRIGQTRPVTVYRLLTRGTVEEKVVRLQANKRALAAAIDETGAADASGWSMEDLKAVIAAD
jgi:superfamily II DNA or RNA helicase